MVSGAAPHVGLQRLARGQEDRLAQREEDGEPAEHARRVRRRVDAQPHVAVQLRDAGLAVVIWSGFCDIRRHPDNGSVRVRGEREWPQCGSVIKCKNSRRQLPALLQTRVEVYRFSATSV